MPLSNDIMPFMHASSWKYFTELSEVLGKLCLSHEETVLVSNHFINLLRRKNPFVEEIGSKETKVYGSMDLIVKSGKNH